MFSCFLRILLKVFGVYVDSCILYRLFPRLVVLQWLFCSGFSSGVRSSR